MKTVYAKLIKNILDRLDNVAWENHTVDYFKLIKNKEQMMKDIDIVYKHMDRGDVDKMYKTSAKKLMSQIFKYDLN